MSKGSEFKEVCGGTKSESAPDFLSIVPSDKVDSEFQLHVEELIRLAFEVKERSERGELLQALSSLAAIPSIHVSIVEKCQEAGELNQSSEKQGQESERFGLYL